MSFILFCPRCGALITRHGECDKCGWKENEENNYVDRNRN